MKEPKIYTRDKYLFGYAGNIGVGQLIADCFVFPIMTKHDTMTTRFIPELREFLADYDIAEDTQLLVGTRGMIYEINLADYSCVKHKETAIGSGTAVALGSLYSSKGLVDTRKRLLLGLESAAKHAVGCQKPYDIIEFPK